MVVENSFRVHHYAPARRDESGTVVRTIEFRNAGDPYKRCKDEVDVIYNKVRKLLATVDTWLSNSLSDEITEEVVQSLYISFNKTMAVVSADVEELIITHGMFIVKYNYRKLQMRIGECCISKLEKVAKHSLKTLRNGVAPEW